MDYKEIKQGLESCLDEYITALKDGMPPIFIPKVKQGSRQTPEIHASAFGFCPKLHAAQRLGLADKEFSPRKLYQFALAELAADLYKESVIYWATKIGGNANPEWVVKNKNLIGHIDIMFAYDKQWPIEIKRTDADSHGGLSAYQVWQTIIYMELLDSNEGFLVTLYDGKREPYYTVWCIQRWLDGLGWSVIGDNGQAIIFDDRQIPTYSLVDQSNFFSKNVFDWMIKYHQDWYSDLMTDKPILEDNLPSGWYFDHWECSYTKPAEYYQINYKGYKKGDQKPNTGISVPSCPLFGKCYHSDLIEAQFDPDNLPKELPVYTESGDNFLMTNPDATEELGEAE